jgi:hypothetical protein
VSVSASATASERLGDRASDVNRGAAPGTLIA